MASAEGGSRTAIDTTQLQAESKLVVRPGAIGSSVQEPRTHTIEDAFANMGFGKTQILMFFFCGMAFAGYGMEMMLFSYLGPAVRACTASRASVHSSARRL